MNKKSWLLRIFTTISIMVFAMVGLVACTSIIYLPATMPEGYGALTIRNIDARQDENRNPVSGIGIRYFIVNGISDRNYSWSWGSLERYSNIPGRQPNPMGGTAGGTQRVGDNVTWVDIKNGVEREVTNTFIPIGDYEITIVWQTNQQTKHRVSVEGNKSQFLEVRAP